MGVCGFSSSSAEKRRTDQKVNRINPSGVSDDKLLLSSFFFSSSDFCELTLDSNTADRTLKLSDNNRTVTRGEDQSYPDHPDRFDFRPQLMCSEVLTGRCYWEVEWRGDVSLSVTSRGISRKGGSDDCGVWREPSVLESDCVCE